MLMAPEILSSSYQASVILVCIIVPSTVSPVRTVDLCHLAHQ